jgi:hypothetical protein
MEDERCCGSGTCIINAEGACWCGQRWDGARMCFPELASEAAAIDNASVNSGTLKGSSDHSSD